VAGEAVAIDAGRATARLSAELGGGLAVPDQMSATADFLDAAGAGLGSLSTGSVTAEQRRNATTLVRREGEAPVPPGTRRIPVTVTSRASAPVSSALADNVKFTLATRPHQAATAAAAAVGWRTARRRRSAASRSLRPASRSPAPQRRGPPSGGLDGPLRALRASGRDACCVSSGSPAAGAVPPRRSGARAAPVPTASGSAAGSAAGRSAAAATA
jgi:hypothetical protein